MTGIAVFVGLARVPFGLFRIDLIRGVSHCSGPLDVVKYEEFVLRAKVGRIGNSRRFQIGLGADGYRPGVALITLAGQRLDYITGNIDSGLIGKRVEYGAISIRHQCHVGFVDALPACNRRTIKHLALGKNVLVEETGRDRYMLLLTHGIGESKIDELDAVLFDSV